MLSLFLLSSALADNVTNAAANFTVPELRAYQLSVQGLDFLSLAGDQERLTELSMHLGSTLAILQQAPMYTYSLTNQLDFQTLGDDEELGTALPASLSNDISASAQQFIGTPRGLSVLAGAGMSIDGERVFRLDEPNLAYEENTRSTSLTTRAGVAYGRIVDARTIAQVAAALDELNFAYSEADLLRIAEVVGQRRHYELKYRLEADKEYYAAIAEELGGVSADDLFEFRQVLESPLYNIGPRRVGVEGGAALETLSNGDESSRVELEETALRQYFNYATLLNSTTGLFFSQVFWHRQTSDVHSNQLEMSLSVNKDHTHSWQSQLGLDHTKIFGVTGSSKTIRAETNAALGTIMVFSTGASRTTSNVTDESDWSLYSSFIFYLL